MTAGNDPEPHLGEAEDGVGGGDCDVRARHQPAPAAERVAVHPRDHRRRAGVDRLAHLVQPHRVLDVLVVGQVDRGALPLDVGPGTEGGAFAREDDGACVADQRERLGQLGDERGVERVTAVGTGQRDLVDRAVPLCAQPAHAAAYESPSARR